MLQGELTVLKSTYPWVIFDGFYIIKQHQKHKFGYFCQQQNICGLLIIISF